MAGKRGQGRGGPQNRYSSQQQQQQQNSYRGSRTPQAAPTPSPNSSRGHSRRGGGAGRGQTTPFSQNHTASSRSPWSAGRGASSAGCPGRQAPNYAASPAIAGYTSGSAAVCAEDRALLLIGKDAKMPRVWELRVHPSQRFGTAWLSAVDRWVGNMISSSTEQQQQQQQEEATQHAVATGPPPAPEEPVDMDNDDYDLDAAHDDLTAHNLQDDLEAAAAQRGPGSSGGDSALSEDDVYDMLSYLRKMSINDSSTAVAADADLDAVSCAATAGSSINGRRRSRKHNSRRTAAGAGTAAAAGGAKAHAGDDSDSTGSWETDSQSSVSEERQQQQQQPDEAQQPARLHAGDLDAVVDTQQERQAAIEPEGEQPPQQQQELVAQQGAAIDQNDEDSGEAYEHFEGIYSAASDESEIDAALTAAEEQDLLCENGSAQWHRQHMDSADAGGAGSSAAAVAAAAFHGREPRVRRGDRKRQRWQQQLLVSLRLERQGLTDKEAQQLATWYSSSPAAQHLSICKLWLFDNSLGDAAAAALAPVIGPHTAELHLSHNQIGAPGAEALLAAVPVQRAKGVKPLWFRIEWNQVDQVELRRFIQEECAARGLVVDIAQEVPVNERASRTDSKGRELNLSWSRPWQEVHVQMPWLSCQRSAPAEAAVLKAAKAVWSKRGAAADSSSRDRRTAPITSEEADAQQKHQQQQHTGWMSSRRHGGVVAAASAAAAAGNVVAASSLILTPPPPPPPVALAARASAPAAVIEGSAAAAAEYQDGPLLLFVDTSALLSMLGCGGAVTSNTCFTLKLLQALAGSGRFGRGLPAEQQTFVVLADTVLKQLDSFKTADGGVGGPVRRFLDKGLDEVGPKGLDFLTVLAAHEGEGLVVDRQAAVAGSRSPLFEGTTGQRSDLSIIEVGLFFRAELLAAATAAMAEAAAAGGVGGVDDQQVQEAQPVLLVTNDNAQLQLAKSHGLPAFKLAGASEFEAQVTNIIKTGSDLTSSTLRSLMAPAATAGLGAIAGRSLQDDFDGSVSCLRGLLEVYQDLSGLLGRMSMLLAGALPGEEPAVLNDVQQLLQEHQHPQLFQEGKNSNLELENQGSPCDSGAGVSVLEASLSNISAMEGRLLSWEDRAAMHHTPSRVLKWAGARVARAGSDGL